MVWEIDGSPGSSIQTYADGTFIVLGSVIGDYEALPNFGGTDIYVFKGDSLGEKLWERRFGSTDNDFGISISAIPNGGSILVATFKWNLYEVHPFEGGLPILSSVGGRSAAILKLTR